MKERVTTEVSPGEVLQVHSSRGPIGQAVTVPEGVSSVTVTFRDTADIKAAEARRANKLASRQRDRGKSGKKRRKEDDL